MIFPEYPGHFDGNPIVPGAALLTAVEAAVGRAIAHLDRVRFLGVVRPGEEVEVRFSVDGPALRFSVWRGGVEVVRGVGAVAG